MNQNKSVKIAVTGGIGSGKTTVCKIIEEAGYPVYSCDKIYAELLDCGTFTAELCAAFGDVTDGQNKIDRKKLSEIVFSDEKNLSKLNSITHPKIYEEIFNRAKNDKLAFFEVPLLFESGSQNSFDGVIVVLRDRGERIKAVAERDKILRENIEKRIKSQFDYENNDFTEYYVIHNDGNFDNLYSICVDLLSKITNDYFG